MNQIIAMQAQTVPGLYEVENSQTSGTANPEQWFIDALGGGHRTDSGLIVTPRKALSYSSVFSAVSIISGDVAGVPLEKQTSGDGISWTVTLNDFTSYLLNVEPNPLMNALTFRETIQQHALLWGNGYFGIARDETEAEQMLVPLLPDRTFYEEPPEAPFPRYYTQWETGERQYFRVRDVGHIKGMGFDGKTGYPVVSLAKNSFGLGLTAEKAANTFFKNEGRPNVVLTHPARLDEEQAKDLLDKWQERQAGVHNIGRPALAAGGLNVVPLPPMAARDAQALEMRDFQREEVAAWFRMPAHKLGSTNERGYNTIEAENRAYVSQTLRHWFNKWSAECRVKLLTGSEKRSMRVRWKHNLTDLLEAEIGTRAEVATTLRAAMIANKNEARQMVGLPPVADGDTFENPNTSTGTAEAVRKLMVNQFDAAFQAEAFQFKRYKDKERFYDGWRRKLAAFIGDSIDVANETLAANLDVDEVIEKVIAESQATGEQNWKGRADEVVRTILGVE